MLEVKVPRTLFSFDKKNLQQALRESAQLVANDARALIRTSAGGGRTYTVGREKHHASAPGQPPTSLSGALSRSIRYSVRMAKTGKGDTARIADTAFYARFLEQGAQGGGGTPVKGGRGKRNPKDWKKQNLAPSTKRVLASRPFLTLALDNNADKIRKKLTDAAMADLDFTK